jgi:CRP-like cAMP-binding protein
MAHSYTASTRKSFVKPVHNGVGGRTVQNQILLGLPAKECSAIFSKLEFVSLPTPSVLNEAGERIKFAFFINGGLASVLRVMDDGKSIEVGLCGKEGIVGIPLAAGFSSSPNRIIMQVAGSAFRMKAKDFSTAVRECPALARSLQRFSQELALQSEQVAACNRLHDVEERLARWLLMSQDRLGGSLVPLTQNFLAHMLGTRRASVTVAAGILQKAGLITYFRGQVKVETRTGLEDAACECYGVIVRQSNKWRKEVAEIKRER